MTTTRRTFLQTTALASLAAVQRLPAAAEAPPQPVTPAGALSAFEIARTHTFHRDTPSPAFLEGTLLGNGDVGVCAVVRPDGLGLHFGKNDCWDIRVSELEGDPVLPFPQLLDLLKRASDEAKRQGKPDMVHLEENIDFMQEYVRKTNASYSKKWPRPWPCGTLWLNWDYRWVVPRHYSLDPSNGLLTIKLDCSTIDGPTGTVTLSAFVDWETGVLSLTSSAPLALRSIVYSPEVDGLRIGPFDSGHMGHDTALLPHPQTSVETGSTAAEITCLQHLPAIGPTESQPAPPDSPMDRNFALVARIDGRWRQSAARVATDLLLEPQSTQQLDLAVALATPRDVLLDRMEREASGSAGLSIPQTHVYTAAELETVAFARRRLPQLTGFHERQQHSEQQWKTWWSASAVQLRNKNLERIWYRNQYFLACCLKKNKIAPGLYANWSAGDIGTAWHGDYHTDYNCQQVYWGVFSSNHPEMHYPYIELCENLLAMSEKFAHDKMGMPGAFFPLSAYPVPSQSVPYPVPPWAYQISMTPWTVQSLWWHYLYTQDEGQLRRVYPLLRSATDFVTAFVQKGADGKYHVIPTVSSENWGYTVDFRLNKDCILDLALIEFLLDAILAASETLKLDSAERARWSEIRSNLAPYPTVDASYGKVWGDVRNAPPDWVYNVPITLAPVFPGEQVGLHTPAELELARRTARAIRLEGGNDLVYQPLIRARLGMLDLDWFQREVSYCMLPNGVANDRIRQSGGRYAQSADFDFMMPMGVWCENFALPAVLNECMLQSYAGTLRVFPNTLNLGPASFTNLRAAGAFLVSASYDGTHVTELSLHSQKGRPVRLVSPWPGKGVRITASHGETKTVQAESGIVHFETSAGAHYTIQPS